MTWYYQQHNTEHGPYTGKQIQDLTNARVITPTTPIRKATMNGYKPATQLKGLVFPKPKRKLVKRVLTCLAIIAIVYVALVCYTAIPHTRSDTTPAKDSSTTGPMSQSYDTPHRSVQPSTIDAEKAQILAEVAQTKAELNSITDPGLQAEKARILAKLDSTVEILRGNPETLPVTGITAPARVVTAPAPIVAAPPITAYDDPEPVYNAPSMTQDERSRNTIGGGGYTDFLIRGAQAAMAHNRAHSAWLARHPDIAAQRRAAEHAKPRERTRQKVIQGRDERGFPIYGYEYTMGGPGDLYNPADIQAGPGPLTTPYSRQPNGSFSPRAR